jgi:hypothetical protein
VLVDEQQDTSGDYGYDLVHEAVRRSGSPVKPTDAAEHERRPARARPDGGGDLEYDEAHDF